LRKVGKEVVEMKEQIRESESAVERTRREVESFRSELLAFYTKEAMEYNEFRKKKPFGHVLK
jgi:hypothetical protein